MRGIVLFSLCLLLVGPLLPPLLGLIVQPAGWLVWGESARLVELLGNTLGLCVLTLLLAGPLGWALGLWAGRFGGQISHGLLVVAAFVPLPVYALAWQTIFGNWLPSITLDPGEVAWRAWTAGLLPAAWVHAMAAIPWVGWTVSAAIRRTDRDLEEHALQTGGPSAVVRLVLVPRTLGASLLAGAWVLAQPLTEITVSDSMMVRSVAEEVYTQLVVETGGLAGAVAMALPIWLIASLAVGFAGRRLTHYQFPAANSQRPRPLVLPKIQQWLFRLLAFVSFALFAVLPMLALVWKAAGGGQARAAEFSFLVNELQKVFRTENAVIRTSLVNALIVGVATAHLAWLSLTLARQSRLTRNVLFALIVLLLLVPGPVIGLGLKRFIAGLIDLEELVSPGGPLANLLYLQPSAVPSGWAALLRYFPMACAVIWPGLRAIPDDLLEAARLDRWTGWKLWYRLVLPLTTPAFLTAAVAVAALALGEVSAGKLVNPPGHRTYILWLFDQMHYGSESTLAAMALTQLVLTTAVVALLGLAAGRFTSWSAKSAQ